MKAYYVSALEVREMEGAAETFRILKSVGIKVALDTGFSRDIVDVILHRLSWDTGDLLDATVASDEVQNGRPYPDMIYRAMELAVHPHTHLLASITELLALLL